MFPPLATPVPTPVLQPFIPLRIESDSSSGTLELSGTVHQPFLPEVLFHSPGIPTRNSAELQAFVNHCRFLLGSVAAAQADVFQQNSDNKLNKIDTNMKIKR